MKRVVTTTLLALSLSAGLSLAGDPPQIGGARVSPLGDQGQGGGAIVVILPGLTLVIPMSGPNTGP